MDFRDFLADDASSSMSRALSHRTVESRRGFDAFRQTLNDALLSLDSALSNGGENESDAEISGLVERLTAAMTDHGQASADLVRAEAGEALAIAEKRRTELEATLAERAKTLGESEHKLGDAEEKIRAMIATQEDGRRRHEALVASMGDLQAQQDALQAELDTERGQGADTIKELADAHTAWQEAQTAAQDAESARRQHEHARKALERELLDVRAALDRARADSTSMSASLESAGAECVSLRGALEDLQRRVDGGETERSALADQLEQRTAHIQRLEHLAKDAEGTRRDLQVKFDAAGGREATLRERIFGAEVEASEARAAVQSMNRETIVQPSTPAARSAPFDFDRLVATYRELESGTSESEVLTALTKGLSGQFARVALFGVSGNALQGSYQLGFDIDKDITKIVMPLTMESELTRAFASGQIETATFGGPLDRIGLPFGGESGWCMSMPVVLKGETIAVIYVDHGEQISGDPALQPSRVAFAELLWRHAIPVLVKLTVDLRARTELRAYAMLLLDEVEYVYGADVSAKKQNAELVERLTENLRCAQGAYARRLESVGQPDGGPDLFEERLTTLLDTRGTTAFGRHLSVASAELVRVTSSAGPTSSQTAAQAS